MSGTEERNTVSSSGGQKGVKLERFELIPVGPLTELARLYGTGAEKYTTYGDCTCSDSDTSQSTEKQHKPGCLALTIVETGDRNWEKGYEWGKSYASGQRHFNSFWGGESYDPETGRHNLACVIFHAMALMEWEQTHPEFDNRSSKVSNEIPKDV